MKHAVLGILCLVVLLPVSAFADSLDSITPSSVFLGDEGQFITLQGTGLFGSVDTQVVIDGPAGTFMLEPSSSSVDMSTDPPTDTLIVAVPGEVMVTEGHYSVTVLANDGTSTRSIGPQFFDVVPHSSQQNPLISVPENVFAEATSAAGANVEFFVGGTSFVDPPPAPTITCDHNSGDLFPIGETIVNCTATDSFGSASGNFPVFVLDTGSPVVTVPADIITGNPVVTYTASATDAVDGSVPVNCSPASGSTFDLGTTVVTCIAFDSQANIGIGTFNVTVSNGPVLTLPPNITAEATSAAGAAVSFTVTATDNATVVCTPASGSTFALGTTTVNCTATASTGTTSGSFTVTVVDTTPPVLSLPANITAEGTSPSGAPVSFAATATDIVDGARPVICTPASGSTFPLGTTTVQCTATDTHNNTAHGSFTVLVHDTTPPIIVKITATPDILWPPNHHLENVSISVIATDAVDPAPMSHIVSVSSNQPVNGIGDGNTSPDWEITGALTLRLRAERAFGIACLNLLEIIFPGVECDRIYTITIATTDASGNTSYGTVTVKVTDPHHFPF